MTVTVQTSAHLGLSKGQHRTVFRNERGLKRYYSFYYDTANSELRYEYSADGISWVGAAAVTTDDPDSFDVKYHNDGAQMEVWVVWHNGTSTGELRYRAGTVADAASAITWSAAEQDIDAAINDEALGQPHCVALARTDNGRIVVAFTEDLTNMGKDYRLTNIIGSDGDGAAPNWLGEIILQDPSGNSNNQNKGEIWFGLESFSSSYPNKVLFHARVPSGNSATDYYCRTAALGWDGANFTGTAPLDWYDSGSSADASKVIAAIIDESDIAHAIFYDATDGRLEHDKADSAGNDDWSRVGTAISSGDVDACTLTLDTGPATDLLYAFYRKSADSVDWSYKTSPVDVISWSSEKVVSYHQTITALSSWNRQIENSLHIAGLYGTTVIYNEQPVYKALSTTLADLEFPDQNYYLGPHDL